MRFPRSFVAGLALAAGWVSTMPGVLGASETGTAAQAGVADTGGADHLLRQAAGMRRAGKYGLALEASLEALRILRTPEVEDDLKTARIQEDIADLYLKLNLVHEAGPFARASHATFSRLLPSMHIDVVRSLAVLGRWQTLSGQFSDAEQTLLRARDLANQIVGENDPETGVVLAYLGMLYDAKGELQLAESLLTKARAALLSKGGASLDARITDLEVELAAARTIMEKGDYLRAALGVSSIGERANARYGIEHPRTAEVLQTGGELLLGIGQRKQAAGYFWAAYQIRSKTLGDRNPETIASIRSLAGTYEIRNRDDAVAMLKLLDIVADAHGEAASRESVEYATLLAERGYFQALIGNVAAATETFGAAVRLARTPIPNPLTC